MLLRCEEFTYSGLKLYVRIAGITECRKISCLNPLERAYLFRTTGKYSGCFFFTHASEKLPSDFDALKRAAIFGNKHLSSEKESFLISC